MASTYTVNLGIEKIGTGEQSGTWGTTTNTNFDLIDQAVNGAVTVTLASAGTSGSPNTLEITNGAASDGRNKFIEFDDGGDLGASAYVQLTPNDAEKIVHVRNSLSGGQTLILFQGTYNASNDFEVPNGKDVVLKFDGAGASATVTDVFTDLQATAITTPDLTATTADINGGTIDGATIATSDITVGSGKTLDVSAGTFTVANDQISGDAIDGGTATPTTLTSTTVNATTVDTTNIEVTNLKAKDGTAAGSIADSTGVVTLASSVLTTTDINGGTIDGVTIGGSSAGAITGTTGTFSGNLTVDTNTLFVDAANNRVGVGTASPTRVLHLSASGTESAIRLDNTVSGRPFIITYDDSENLNFINSSDTGYMAFTNGTGAGTERMRIDSSGRLLLGTSTARSNFFNSTASAALQVEGSGDAGRISALRSDAAGTLILGYTQAASDNNVIGYVSFQGNDGSEFVETASIQADIDGTPGANDMPGRLVFSTTANGNSSVTERMRIDSSGRVGIGTSSPSQALDVVGNIEVSGGVYLGGTTSSNLLDDYEEGTFTPVFTGGTTAGTYTYLYQTGRYTKIGNVVNVAISLVDINTVSAGSGNVVITGLPFTSSNITALGYTGKPVLSRWTLTTGGTDDGFFTSMGANGTSFNIVKATTGASGTGYALQVSDKASNSSDIFVSFSYRTDA